MAGENGEFDMGNALAEVSEGLGFESTEVGDGGQVEGELPTGEAVELPEGDEQVEAKPEDEAATDPAAAPAIPAAPGPNDPPKTWRTEALAKWETIDPVVKAEIQKREDDFFKGIEQYKSSATIGNNFRTVMDQYMPLLEQHGIDPYQQVAGLMEAHKTLALGTPEQRSAMFQKLARDYKVDVKALAGVVGEPPYVDPEVAALREKTESLQSTVQQMTQAQRQQRETELRANIEKFAGDPKNVHFNDVAKDMAVLLKTGVCQTLDDAYQKAIWQNPTTRAKEIASQTAASEAARKAEEAKRVAAAKKATGANAPTSRPSSRTAPAASMDDTIETTLATIKARG